MRRPLHSDRGAVIFESALCIPFLVIILFGLFGLGRLYLQVSWLTSTTYESILAGSENIESVGHPEMNRIKVMFEDVLNKHMLPVSMTRSYYTENDSNGDEVSLIKVGLSGQLLPTQGWDALGLKVEFVGAHTGKDQGFPEDPHFEVLTGPYNCAGARCGGDTGNTCPSSPCGS